MLESIVSFMPEVAPATVTCKATSLQWVYNHLREHYGCARTGRDMLQKFKTLARRPGERLRAYWSRFTAFYEENRIKKDDKLKTNGATAVKTEEQCRYSQSSELALFLHMAHPLLPERITTMFHAKLENADLASLKDMILERSQAILDELEGSHASVNRQQWSQQSRAQYNRGYQTSQHNRGFQARPPPERRSYQRQSQRPGGATRRSHTPSPTRAPRNPEHYCYRCLEDPQRKHKASTHFFRQCPTKP